MIKETRQEANITKTCDLEYNDHSWIKKAKIFQDIDQKFFSKSDLDMRSFQMVYFEKEINDKGSLDNADLIKSFNKNNPGTNLKIHTRDITIIKQNLKNKRIEARKAVERVDSIVNSLGLSLLVEKVKDLLYFIFVRK